MVNYANSKIYKITCNVTGLTYYGSTVNPLSKRMGQHRSDFKKNGLCKSKLVLASGDYDYCLVEKFPCDDKTELHQRERFYIETNECVNARIPGRTDKEYYEDNRETILEQRKAWRDAHQEEISEYKKEHYLANKEKITAKAAATIPCECGCSVRKSSITRHKKSQRHIDLMSKIEQSL